MRDAGLDFRTERAEAPGAQPSATHPSGQDPAPVQFADPGRFPNRAIVGEVGSGKTGSVFDIRAHQVAGRGSEALGEPLVRETNPHRREPVGSLQHVDALEVAHQKAGTEKDVRRIQLPPRGLEEDGLGPSRGPAAGDRQINAQTLTDEQVWQALPLPEHIRGEGVSQGEGAGLRELGRERPVVFPVRAGAGIAAECRIEGGVEDVGQPPQQLEAAPASEETPARPAGFTVDAVSRAPATARAVTVDVTFGDPHRDGDDAVGLRLQFLAYDDAAEHLHAVQVAPGFEDVFGIVDAAFAKGKHAEDDALVHPRVSLDRNGTEARRWTLEDIEGHARTVWLRSRNQNVEQDFGVGVSGVAKPERQ